MKFCEFFIKGKDVELMPTDKKSSDVFDKLLTDYRSKSDVINEPTVYKYDGPDKVQDEIEDIEDDNIEDIDNKTDEEKNKLWIEKKSFYLKSFGC